MLREEVIIVGNLMGIETELIDAQRNGGPRVQEVKELADNAAIFCRGP
jgi:hypothetical protein